MVSQPESVCSTDNIFIDHIKMGIVMGKCGHVITLEQIKAFMVYSAEEKLCLLEEANAFLRESDCDGARRCREMMKEEV